MNAELRKKALPPYIPYSTFINFINSLKETTFPTHIDKTLMTKMSGSGQSAMIAALKSLDLINSQLEPTKTLKSLVEADESQSTEIIAGIVKKAYPFIFDGSIDIEKTTSKKVEDKFRAIGASGSTLTKTIAFFLAASKAGGIVVSPHVKAPKISSSTKRRSKNKAGKNTDGKSRGTDGADKRANSQDQEMERIPIPFRGMQDGKVYLPKGLEKESAKKAVAMVNFILKNYYDLGGDQ